MGQNSPSTAVADVVNGVQMANVTQTINATNSSVTGLLRAHNVAFEKIDSMYAQQEIINLRNQTELPNESPQAERNDVEYLETESPQSERIDAEYSAIDSLIPSPQSDLNDKDYFPSEIDDNDLLDIN